MIGLDIPNAEEMSSSRACRPTVEIATDAKLTRTRSHWLRLPTLAPARTVCGASRRKAGKDRGERRRHGAAVRDARKTSCKQGHGMAVAIVGIPAGMKVPTDMKQLTDLREKA